MNEVQKRLLVHGDVIITIVQYLRPEIMGIALGAFFSALAFGEFRARGGSTPLVRFFGAPSS
ncbi:hypothetical protein MTAT_07870 [Moorella thermoacetica]|uniref:Uncharacterized protein n=1 Tax=Neomoorella thermoacetica TaxID=1525 RepID=A0A5D3I7A6_NEOTH|nr:hypothetical protein [Moorella thermoacetica]AOQ24146.1 hypothetical protein Maut_01709 [Moorella thermoacetica]OIQ11427.1 hypothetical protein MOOTH_16290 [Moorella thermoacetica]OIQ61391.1 hypothetical protein MTIN_14670 [Moorella thermoacetica]TYL14552.1 hypothetical protein MTAT_07870 [Moorella thermoacetica]